MRHVLAVTLTVIVITAVRADEPAKQVELGKKLPPGLILKSAADGKQSCDLAKLAEEGPVLVRLTCACTGCDKELPQFQKLQAAYQAKGLKTVAVFREKPEATSDYAAKKDLKFSWLSDPNGDLWKTFDTKAMPTNILIDKGGRVVKVVPGCTVDGKNAQALSKEIATLLKTDEVKIVEQTKK
jgi:peroxiredoxin